MRVEPDGHSRRPWPNGGAERGVTLLELMIASAIAAVIAFGLGTMEGSRARMTEEIRRQAGLLEPDHKNAALAATHLAKSLETADRFERIAEGANWRLNVRLPDCQTADPTCFDNALKYQWVQYRLDTASGELRMYRFARTASLARPLPCPAGQVLAREVTALAFPTVGSNLVQYQVTWTSGTRSHTFQGQVITRFKPDQVVAGTDTGLQGPGADISPPPGGTGCT